MLLGAFHVEFSYEIWRLPLCKKVDLDALNRSSGRHPDVMLEVEAAVTDSRRFAARTVPVISPTVSSAVTRAALEADSKQQQREGPTAADGIVGRLGGQQHQSHSCSSSSSSSIAVTGSTPVISRHRIAQRVEPQRWHTTATRKHSSFVTESHSSLGVTCRAPLIACSSARRYLFLVPPSSVRLRCLASRPFPSAVWAAVACM